MELLARSSVLMIQQCTSNKVSLTGTNIFKRLCIDWQLMKMCLQEPPPVFPIPGTMVHSVFAN